MILADYYRRYAFILLVECCRGLQGWW